MSLCTWEYSLVLLKCSSNILLIFHSYISHSFYIPETLIEGKLTKLFKLQHSADEKTECHLNTKSVKIQTEIHPLLHLRTQMVRSSLSSKKWSIAIWTLILQKWWVPTGSTSRRASLNRRWHNKQPQEFFSKIMPCIYFPII